MADDVFDKFASTLRELIAEVHPGQSIRDWVLIIGSGDDAKPDEPLTVSMDTAPGQDLVATLQLLARANVSTLQHLRKATGRVSRT